MSKWLQTSHSSFYTIRMPRGIPHEALRFPMVLHAQEGACLIEATIASTAPCAFTCFPINQIPFALLDSSACYPQTFPQFLHFNTEHTITFYRGEMHLLLMPKPFIPTSGESLDLWHIIVQCMQIGTAWCWLFNYQSIIWGIFILLVHQHAHLAICRHDLILVHYSLLQPHHFKSPLCLSAWVFPAPSLDQLQCLHQKLACLALLIN